MEVSILWIKHTGPAEAVRPVRLWPDHFFEELIKFIIVIELMRHQYFEFDIATWWQAAS